MARLIICYNKSYVKMKRFTIEICLEPLEVEGKTIYTAWIKGEKHQGVVVQADSEGECLKELGVSLMCMENMNAAMGQAPTRIFQPGIDKFKGSWVEPSKKQMDEESPERYWAGTYLVEHNANRSKQFAVYVPKWTTKETVRERVARFFKKLIATSK